MEPFNLSKINDSDSLAGTDIRPFLLQDLQEIQEAEGYISDENMQRLAERYRITPVRVYSVVTFYSFLSTEKKGAHIIRVSDCVSSVLKGSDKVLSALEDKLGVRCGETTPDGKITLERTGCIGMCDCAPALMCDDRLIGPVDEHVLDRLIDELRNDEGESR